MRCDFEIFYSFYFILVEARRRTYFLRILKIIIFQFSGRSSYHPHINSSLPRIRMIFAYSFEGNEIHVIRNDLPLFAIFDFLPNLKNLICKRVKRPLSLLCFVVLVRNQVGFLVPLVYLGKLRILSYFVFRDKTTFIALNMKNFYSF